MSKRQILFQMLFMSLATVVIMLTLRPFGVGEINFGYVGYSLGVALMVSVAYGFAGFLLFNLCRWRSDSLLLTLLVFMLPMILILSVLLTCFDSFYACGEITAKWFDTEGNFSLQYFLTNFLYVVPMTVVIGGLSYFIESNRQLRINLREAVEMNEALRVRQQAAEPIETSENVALTIEATSGKERLELTSENDVLYIESDANYVNVFFVENNAIQRKTLRATMLSMEEQLASCKQLVRCHRAYFVNLQRVQRVSGNSQGYRLTLDMGEQTVPVSRQYASRVQCLVLNA